MPKPCPVTTAPGCCQELFLRIYGRLCKEHADYRYFLTRYRLNDYGGFGEHKIHEVFRDFAREHGLLGATDGQRDSGSDDGLPAAELKQRRPPTPARQKKPTRKKRSATPADRAAGSKPCPPRKKKLKLEPVAARGRAAQ
jgi:hypothetical protein